MRQSKQRRLAWTGLGLALLALLYIVISLLLGLDAPTGAGPLPGL